MSISSDLISAIKAGQYSKSYGEVVSYKEAFVEMLTYAKEHGYTEATLLLNQRLNYVDRRIKEISTRIDILTSDSDAMDYSKKYNVLLSFIQNNAKADAAAIPAMSSACSALSTKFTSLKNLCHELSVLTYNETVITATLSNLSSNSSSITSVISDISAIS